MKGRKLKRLLIFVVTLVVLAGIFGVFFIIIINTPNLNANIKFVANNVNGTVSGWIRNAENGLPYNYFSFDDTADEQYEQSWISKNVQFKGDKETITIELRIKNMSHFKMQSTINYNNAHKNANITTFLNATETTINDLVFAPNSENTVIIVIGKKNFKDPIRAKLKLTVQLSPYVETPELPEEELPEISEP